MPYELGVLCAGIVLGTVLSVFAGMWSHAREAHFYDDLTEAYQLIAMAARRDRDYARAQLCELEAINYARRAVRHRRHAWIFRSVSYRHRKSCTRYQVPQIV